MAISDLPISYCANVHPGETFDEAWASLKTYTAPLRRRIGRPIAVGIWLTRNAVMQAMARPSLIGDLKAWLADHGLVCYTANAFPFGNFHARRVKEQVYLPDWTNRERLEYTCRVADLLAQLLPDNAEGSISTSPCAFKPLHPAGASWNIYFPLLIETAGYLAELQRRTGRMIRLAIEPEPACVLETTDEALAFFADLFATSAAGRLAAAVHQHLGLCYDVCHQAVEFENVTDSIARIDAAGIRVQKVHVTCALELPAPTDADARRRLATFVEERYLHQTLAIIPGEPRGSATGPFSEPQASSTGVFGEPRASATGVSTRPGQRLLLLDLTTDHANNPPAEWLDCPQWRIHFHVPVDRETIGPLRTTRPVLQEALSAVGRLAYSPHLEVETYTWNVMPTDPSTGEPFDLVAGLQAELESAYRMLDVVGTLRVP